MYDLRGQPPVKVQSAATKRDAIGRPEETRFNPVQSSSSSHLGSPLWGRPPVCRRRGPPVPHGVGDSANWQTGGLPHRGQKENCRQSTSLPCGPFLQFPVQFSKLPLVLLFISCLLAFSSRAATFVTISETGPSSNRLDIVFLAESYTSAQSARFFTDATNALAGLLSHEPLASYRNAFNAYAIYVASPQSGSDHLGLSRNTYFNSGYDPVLDFIITIPLDDQGQGKVDALLQTYKPDADLPVLLVNDPVPGGSDGFGATAIVSVGSGASDLLAHEVGHVLAGLGDEYETPYPGFPDTEEPNTTRETQRDRIKWKAWIAPETPLPTPETLDFEQTVGLFEGAHYHSAGWFRPKLDCKMNHPPVAFCEVCSEALVLAIYSKVRPIDAVAPLPSQPVLAAGAPLVFGVALLEPVPNTLHLQWLTNGTAMAGATATNLLLSPASIPAGSNTVAVRVFDATGLVRTDPADLRAETITWSVLVQPPAQLRLEQPHRTADGMFAFRVIGAPEKGVVIDSSGELPNWTPVFTNAPSPPSFWFSNSVSSAAQFFRARLLP